MIDVYEATVFCDKDGRFGDKHGIIIDEDRKIDSDRRLRIAAELGYAETIYINDIAKSDVSFFAQTGVVPFAGSAALAAAGMLQTLTVKNPKSLTSQNNEILVEISRDIFWIEADLSVMPPWDLKQLSITAEVEDFSLEDAKNIEHTMVWAWIDEKSGVIRARTFAPDWLLPEVQANGSGSMILASNLDKRIFVIHGAGSIILAEPKPHNMARLGGSVIVKDTPIASLAL